MSKGPTSGTRELIDRIVSAAGGQSKLAATIGAHAQQIREWRTKDRPVPSNRCIALEMVAEGKHGVTRYDLRPDVFGKAPPPADPNVIAAAKKLAVAAYALIHAEPGPALVSARSSCLQAIRAMDGALCGGLVLDGDVNSGVED